MTRAALLTLLVTIVALLFLSYSDLGRFLFAEGSDSLLILVRPALGAVIAVNVGILAWLLFLIWKGKVRLLEVGVLVFLLVVWILSSRVVGRFSDGRIIAGFWCFRTGTVDFREPNEDWESYAAHTEIDTSFRSILEVESHGQSARIFVGPLLDRRAVDLLTEAGFSTKKR